MKLQVPNALTLGSLVLGFGELGAVLSGKSHLAAGFLLWALLLDGLAGQLARHRDGKSDLGAELDQLASLIAFGIGVMVLAFERSLRDIGPWGWIVAVAVAVATALRLSRDNPSKPDWPRYQGLPVPAFGAAVGLLAVMDQPPRIMVGACLALAVLMLSPLSYARFSQKAVVQAPLGALIALAALFPQFRPAVLMLALAYALGGAFFDFWGVLEREAPRPKRVKKAS